MTELSSHLKAVGVDKKPRIVSFDNEVVRLWRADAHRVLQAGTSALFDRKPETRCFRVETLLLDERMELRGGVGGEFNHIHLLGTNWGEVKWGRTKARQDRLLISGAVEKLG